MAEQTAVRLTVEHDVLVHFIAQQVGRGIAQGLSQLLQIVGAEDGACRIVWKVDNDETGFVVEVILQPLPVDPEIKAVVADGQRDMTRPAAGERYRRLIGIVGRVEHDDLITSSNDGLDRTE